MSTIRRMASSDDPSSAINVTKQGTKPALWSDTAGGGPGRLLGSRTQEEWVAWLDALTEARRITLEEILVEGARDWMSLTWIEHVMRENITDQYASLVAPVDRAWEEALALVTVMLDHDILRVVSGPHPGADVWPAVDAIHSIRELKRQSPTPTDFYCAQPWVRLTRVGKAAVSETDDIDPGLQEALMCAWEQCLVAAEVAGATAPEENTPAQ